MVLDSFPVTASSVARFFHMKGSTLERYYKDFLSDYEDWNQKEHAKEWMLIAKNLGRNCSIDETKIGDEVYTIFSNKDGHGRRGTIIAVVRGTKASVVANVLKMIPLCEREKVKEVTMDFSDSMSAIVRDCFPNATIIIDCFHVVQRLCESLDSLRMKFKRTAVTQTKKAKAKFEQEEDKKAKRRKNSRARYAAKNAGKKKPKGGKRGRKCIRKKAFKPEVLEPVGDTLVE